MANGGRIDYTIGFNVDQSGLNKIKQQLTTLQKMSEGTFASMNKGLSAEKLNTEFNKMKKSASQLQQAMDAAFNPKLNSYSPKIFSESLKTMNTDVNTLYENMARGGAAGTAAFNRTALAIANTSSAIRTSTTMMDKFAETIINVTKYNIANIIFRGFTSSISGALDFAKELDSSLNNIRIVSGQSAEQMAQFAEYANKAAQTLGAKTTDITNASLIYYQQGLAGDDVTERAEITTKLANIIGSSASDVSNYMTAIWNNFNDGSKSLEYYADVLAKLGANTASSSEEIAEGMQKFASVANTTGLSYETASAALATVVAQTRQSADTIGTSFKTIFARLEDLEQGGTTEEGTTLGQYSKALEKIGVNIKNSEGSIKSLDAILAESGEKWKTLSQETKIATAQAVAGTRQYSIFMSLMDNWDTVKENVNLASNATGELSTQQSTYMESLEAHFSSLSAAVENFQNALLNDNFKSILKLMLDISASIVNVGAGITKMFGGLTGVLPLVVTLFTTLGSNSITRALDADIDRMVQLKEQKELLNQKMEWIEGIKTSNAYLDDNNKTLKETIKLFEEIGKKADSMGEKTREAIGKIVENTNAEANQYYEQSAAINELNTTFSTKINLDTTKDFNSLVTELKSKLDGVAEVSSDSNGKLFIEPLAEAAEEAEDLMDKLNNYSLLLQDISDNGKRVKGGRRLKIRGKNNANLKSAVSLGQEVGEIINKQTPSNADLKRAVEAFGEKVISAVNKEKNLTNIDEFDFSKLDKQQMSVILGNKELTKSFMEIIDQVNGTAQKQTVARRVMGAFSKETFVSKDSLDEFLASLELVKNKLGEIDATKKFISGIADLSSAIMGVSALTTGLKNIGDMLSGKIEPSITGIVSTIGSLLIGFNELTKIPGILKNIKGGFSGITEVIPATVISDINSHLGDTADKITELTLQQAAAYKILTPLLGEEAAAARVATGATEGLTAAMAKAAAGLLLWTLIITGAIAIGYSLYKLAEAMITGKTRETEAYKKATEQAEKSNKAYEEAKTKVDNLSSSYDTLIKKLDSLKGITKNTTAWANAIGEVNSQVLELVKNYPALANSIEMVDGHLSINEQDYTDFFNRLSAYSAASSVQSLNDANNVEITGNNQTISKGLSHLSLRTKNQLKEVANRNGNSTVGTVKQSLANAISNEDIRILTSKADSDGKINLTDSKVSEIVKRVKNSTGIDEKAVENILSTTQNIEDIEEIKNLITKNNVLQEKQIAEEGTLVNSMLTSTQKGGVDLDEYAGYAIERYAKASKAYSDFLAKSKEEIISIAKGMGIDTTSEDFDWKEVQKTLALSESVAALTNETVKKISENKGFINDLYNGGGIWKDSKEKIIEGKNKDDIVAAIAEEKATVTMKTDLEFYGPDGEKQDLSDKAIELKGKIKITEISDEFTDAEKESVISGYNENAGKSDKITTETFDELAQEIGSNSKEYAAKSASAKSEAQLDEDLVKAEEKLSKAMSGGNQKIIERAEANYEARKAAKANAFSQEDLKDVLNKTTANAIDMSAGVTKLASNFESWNKVLRTGTTGTIEYAEAMASMKGAIADMLGEAISAEDITDEFVNSNQTLLSKIAETGDESAFQDLRNKLSQSMIDGLNFVETGNGRTVQDAQDAINGLIGELKANTDDFSLNGTVNLDDSQYIDTLNEMLKAGNITAEEVTKIFAAWGYTPEYEEVPIGTQTIDKVYDVTVLDSAGNEEAYTYNVKETESITAPVIKGSNRDGTTAGYTGTGNAKAAAAKNNKSKNNSKKKGSSSKPSKKDKSNDKEDIYRDVNQQLDKISKNLSNIQTIESNLVGDDLKKNLQEQLDLLNKQVQKRREKLRLEKQELANLKKTLRLQGFTFNSDGTMNNSAQALQAAEDSYNAVIEKYNSQKTKDAQEKMDADVENAKARYDQIKEWVSEYDSLLKEVDSDVNEIQSDLQSMTEKKIKKFKVDVELKLDLTEATEKWNDFLNEIKSTDWYSYGNNGYVNQASEILGNNKYSLASVQNTQNSLAANAKHLQEVMSEINKYNTNPDAYVKNKNSVYASYDEKTGQYDVNQNQMKEDLKERYSSMIENIKSIYESAEKLNQSYMNMLDDADEKFQTLQNDFEFLTNSIENYIKLSETLRGDSSTGFGERADLYSQNQELLNSQLSAANQTRIFWEEQYQIAVAKGDEERIKQTKEKMQEAISDVQEKTNRAIENAGKLLETQISKAAKAAEDIFTAGEGYDYLESQWDLIDKYSSSYLDTLNKQYSIQKLQNKYTDALNNNDSLYAQQQITALMNQQLEYLREKENLSEYDVERAEKLLELQLKEIALQEAQRNKSSTRLQRDSRGNYSYQYMADEDAVNKARDDLNEGYDSLYNFDKEQMKSTQQDIIKLYKEMMDALEEIGNNKTLSDEQREARLAETRTYYMDLILAKAADNQTAFYNVAESGSMDLEWLAGDTSAKVLEIVGTANDEMVQKISKSIDDIGRYTSSEIQKMCNRVSTDPDSFKNTVLNTVDEIIQANNSYKTNIDNVEKAAGEDFNNLTKTTKKLEEQTKATMDSAEDLYKTYKNNLSTIQNQIDKIKGTIDALNRQGGMIEVVREAYNLYLKDLAKKPDVSGTTNAISAIAKTFDNMKTAADNAKSAADNAINAVNNLNTAQKNAASAAKTNKVYYIGDDIVQFTLDSSLSNQKAALNQAIADYLRVKKKGAVTVVSGQTGTKKRVDSKGVTELFDTGGYTGEWGSDGRLAMLHQKELVLNASDTENFLQAIDITRGMANILNTLSNAIGSSKLESYVKSSSDNNIEQHIEINAGFPGVEKASEIQNAFDNLINLATQKANQNK